MGLILLPAIRRRWLFRVLTPNDPVYISRSVEVYQTGLIQATKDCQAAYPGLEVELRTSATEDATYFALGEVIEIGGTRRFSDDYLLFCSVYRLDPKSDIARNRWDMEGGL